MLYGTSQVYGDNNNCATNCADILDRTRYQVPSGETRNRPNALKDWFKQQ